MDVFEDGVKKAQEESLSISYIQANTFKSMY